MTLNVCQVYQKGCVFLKRAMLGESITGDSQSVQGKGEREDERKRD